MALNPKAVTAFAETLRDFEEMHGLKPDQCMKMLALGLKIDEEKVVPYLCEGSLDDISTRIKQVLSQKKEEGEDE